MTQPDLHSPFSVVEWNETPLAPQEPGIPMTRVQARYRYTGDLQGTSTVHFVMTYTPDGSATFVGLECLTGTRAKQSGTLLIEHRGTFQSGRVHARIRVLQDHSLGTLATALAEGEVTCVHPNQNTMRLSGPQR